MVETSEGTTKRRAAKVEGAPARVTIKLTTAPITSNVKINLQSLGLPAQYSELLAGYTQVPVELGTGGDGVVLEVLDDGSVVGGDELERVLVAAGSIIDRANAARLAQYAYHLRAALMEAVEVNDVSQL